MKKLPFVFVLFWLVLTTAPVHAYLDPGAGSIMLQLILGGLAGSVVILRLCWNRLRAMLRRKDAPSFHGPASTPRS